MFKNFLKKAASLKKAHKAKYVPEYSDKNYPNLMDILHVSCNKKPLLTIYMLPISYFFLFSYHLKNYPTCTLVWKTICNSWG